MFILKIIKSINITLRIISMFLSRSWLFLVLSKNIGLRHFKYQKCVTPLFVIYNLI